MNSLSSRYSLFALLCLLLASCATGPGSSSQITEARIKQEILGKWETIVRSGSVTVIGEKTFYPDGTAQGVLYYFDVGSGKRRLVETTPFRSRWRVSGDLVTTYDVRSQPPERFDPGEIMVDRVLKMGPRVWKWHDITHAAYYKNTRLPDAVLAQ